MIAVGTSVSFLYGAVVLFILAYGFSYDNMELIHHYTHELYFESTTVILVLITLGKYFETKAKGKTSQAIEKLIALVPENTWVLRANEEVEINMKEGNKMKILIKVNDMSCQHCVKHVDATLNAIEGINDVVVSLKKGEASFTATDTVDINEAIAAVTEAGYPASLLSE